LKISNTLSLGEGNRLRKARITLQSLNRGPTCLISGQLRQS
jgi:hypothetical protein